MNERMFFLAQIWNQVIDVVVQSINNTALWTLIGKAILKIISVVFIAGLLIRVGKSLIRNLFKLRQKGPLRITEKREMTLLKLLENVLTYVVYFISIIMVLEALGVKVTAILAGAGVIGLAVGFGAQNLVRDVITGFFIIFEDQFSVGDYIRTGAHEGTVEEIGLRTTKIQAITGELHIIPNGSILEVTNFSIHNSLAIVDVSIAYEGDISKAEGVIGELIKDIHERYEEMVKPPELLGVQMLGASEVVLRITSEVTPMSQWKIARALRKEIKTHLDAHGIEIPFPRLVMYNRNEEETTKQQKKEEVKSGE